MYSMVPHAEPFRFFKVLVQNTLPPWKIRTYFPSILPHEFPKNSQLTLSGLKNSWFLDSCVRVSADTRNNTCFCPYLLFPYLYHLYRRNRLDVHRLMSLNLMDRECNRLMPQQKIWRHLADGQYFIGHDDDITLLGFLCSYHIENEED